MITKRTLALVAATIAAMAIAPAVQAADATAPAAPAAAPSKIPLRVMLKTADGHRVGFIEAIDTDRQGNQSAAQVIFDSSRIIHVPVSTITPEADHYVTSLTLKDLRKL